MKSRLLFLLLFALPLLSCDDDPGGIASGRFVYYVKGHPYESVEFHRFDVESGKDELLSTDRVHALSAVASNGRILYETRSGSWPYTYQLFGRCEDGQTIPVPMPVASDPAETFEYASLQIRGTSEELALSHDGHHAAFFAWQRPVTGTDSLDWKLHLCVFDCSAWKMRTLELGSVLRPYFAERSMMLEEKPPTPYFVAIANDGGIAVARLMLRVRPEGGEPVWKWVTLGGTLDRMLVLPLDSLPSRQIAFEGGTGTLYVSLETHEGVAFDCRGGSRPTPYWSTPNITQSLSPGSGERAWHYFLGDRAFLIVRPADGKETVISVTREAMLAAFPDSDWLAGGIEHDVALSPDGEWLAFRSTEYEKHPALYVMRRDGTGLRRVAEGVFDVPPVVSEVVPY